MYEKLRDFFIGPGKHENKDVLLFHGWKSNWLNKGSMKANGEEFDFILVYKLHKVIINIEVKNTLSASSVKSLCKQLPRKSMFFLKKYEKFAESLGWRFMKVAASHSKADEVLPSICEHCRDFFIFKDTNFDQLWLK